MMIMPGAILMGLMNPLAGRLFDKFGGRALVITGLSIVTITTLFYTQLSADTTFAYVTVVFAIRMLGIAMVMMPVTTEGLNQLQLDLIPHGTAMNNTMRQISASIGTALLVTVMTMSALDSGPSASPADLIHGVNVAFGVASVLAFAGVVLAFFIRPKAQAENGRRRDAESADAAAGDGRQISGRGEKPATKAGGDGHHGSGGGADPAAQSDGDGDGVNNSVPASAVQEPRGDERSGRRTD